jgi:hypothetical protein
MGARRCVGVAVLMAVAGLLVAGCESAQRGTAEVSAADRQRADARAGERAAASAAIKALGDAAALAYKADTKGADGKPVDAGFEVTKNESALGTVVVGQNPVKLVVAGKQQYVSAPEAYWKGTGENDDASKRWAAGWVAGGDRFSPQATLDPVKLAAALQRFVDSLDRLSDPVRSKLPDGTEVYVLRSGDGTLEVTTAAPYRVVSFSASIADKNGEGISGNLLPTILTGDALRKFHTDLDDALGQLGRPKDFSAKATVNIVGNDVTCKSSTFTCTTNAQVANYVSGAEGSTTVHLTLTAEVNGGSLGSQTCTSEADAAAGATTSMSCDVHFAFPSQAGNYPVQSLPTATAEALSTVDAGGLKQKVDTEFTGLGG